MLELQVGEIVRVRPDIDRGECPVSSAAAGHTGMIEALATDEDGDTAALLWFGYKIPMLHSDGCWVYLEWLTSAPDFEEE